MMKMLLRFLLSLPFLLLGVIAGLLFIPYAHYYADYKIGKHWVIRRYMKHNDSNVGKPE